MGNDKDEKGEVSTLLPHIALWTGEDPSEPDPEPAGRERGADVAKDAEGDKPVVGVNEKFLGPFSVSPFGVEDIAMAMALLDDEGTLIPKPGQLHPASQNTRIHSFRSLGEGDPRTTEVSECWGVENLTSK